MANRATDERAFSRHAEVLRTAIAKAISKLGWEAKKNGSDGTIAAVWTSAFFKFKHDVTILVVPAEKSGTKVRVRSMSRVGRYDFGQNAKHIRDLFTEIQKAL
jgi:uncharacterized protein (DUF1499 family)